MKRKTSIIMLLCALSGFVLAGCSGGSSDQPMTPPAGGSTNMPATPPSTNSTN